MIGRNNPSSSSSNRLDRPGDYRVRLGGEVAARFQASQRTSPITDDDLDSLISAHGRPGAREMLQNQELPDTWPVFEQFVIGPGGRLWINPNNKPGGLSRLIVLDPREGRKFTFDLPTNIFISTKQPGRLCDVPKQSSGIEEVVVYRAKRMSSRVDFARVTSGADGNR